VSSPGGPNAQQVEYWNTLGSKWVEVAPRIDAQIGPLGLAAIERAVVRAGEHVLDVGCGCGQATLQLAERVGATGSVVGIDISEPMLARARERAVEAGTENVEFRRGDAQTEPLPENRFDLVFSRYGVMFFADSEAAFANLRAALKPGGRLAFICWQELGKNPWLEQPLGAALAHVPPPEPAIAGAPGPFAFADTDRVRSFLGSAGFDQIAFESLEQPILVSGGGTLDETVSFVLEFGPASRLLEGVGGDVRERVRESVTRVLEAHADADGVRLGSASWIVTARG
jgi:SAM-dependent methyltransferase